MYIYIYICILCIFHIPRAPRVEVHEDFLFPVRVFKLGGRARHHAEAALVRTRRGQSRRARTDCGEHFVLELRPAKGFSYPRSLVSVPHYFNWGGGGGAGKKGTHIVKLGMRIYLSPAFCVVGVFVRWLAFSCGGGSLVDTLCVRRAWIGEGEEGRAKKRNACRKVGDAGLPVSCVLCGWRFGEAVALSWMLAVFPNLGSRNENQTFLY